MRALLELLGLVAPDPARRTPVAVPAWGRRVIPLIPLALALVAVTLAALIARALRALLG